MAAGTIEFNFKGNLDQLKRDLSEATRLAKQSAGEINGRIGGGSNGSRGGHDSENAALFDRIFTRPGRAERRAERLMSGLLAGQGQSVPGVLGGAAIGLGLGTTAGLGIAVLGEAFVKFRDDIKAADEALHKLRDNSSRSLASISALGVSGISNELDSNEGATQSAGKALNSGFSGFRRKLTRGAVSLAKFLLPGSEYEPQQVLDKQHQPFVEAMERRVNLARALATTEKRSVDIQEQRNRGDKLGADIAEMRAKADEKIAGLRLKYGRDPLMAPSLASMSLSIRRGQTLSEEEATREEMNSRRRDRQEAELASINGNFSLSARRRALGSAAQRVLNANETLRFAREGTSDWRRASTEAGSASSAFMEARFSDWSRNHGETGFNHEAAKAERRSMRERASFKANDADRADRQKRGAHDDSSDMGSGNASDVLNDIKDGIQALNEKWE